MKLSAYIALLEKLRASEGDEVDVFSADTNVTYGRGLMGIKEPFAPSVLPLIKDRATGETMFIAKETFFREEFRGSYESKRPFVLIG